MSNWLGDVSDSEPEDSEVESAEVESSSSSDENEGFSRWAKKDDDSVGGDDDGNNRALSSNRDKALQAVCDACDKFDFVDFDDEESWQESVELFSAVCEATDKFMNKYNKLPEAFAHLMDTLGGEIENHKDDFESNKGARKHYIQFTKRVEQKREQYQVQIERVLNGEDDDDEGVEGEEEREDEKQLTREAMEQFLLNAPTTKSDIRMCRRIITTSRQMGAKPLEIAATAHLCTCLLENAPSTGPSSSQWREAYRALTQAMNLALDSDQKISISEAGGKFTDKVTTIKNGWSVLATNLHESLVKAVQNTEYVPSPVRIKDEVLAASALDRCLEFYMGSGQKRGIGRCAAALLEIVYVRTQAAHQILAELAPKYALLGKPMKEIIEVLTGFVSAHVSDAQAKTMAKLAHIYNLALQDRFHEARDLFLQENIQLDPVEDDDQLLVRYNRVVAQLGLCAFRSGLFSEAHGILNDLCSKKAPELRELLGQQDLLRNPRRQLDEDMAKTARDRLRFVPPHHAMPIQVIEHGHLVLSMANDVIAEAKNPEERPQRSKQFFSLCKRHEHALFRGPPNDDNERIYAAYEALQDGAMQRAIDLVMAVSSWSLLPEGCAALKLLEAKLRSDGLKVFLIKRGQHYASLTVDELVKRFGLSAEEVKSIVSRLLLDHTLIGHWDGNDSHVVIERGPQSRFHMLSRDCADRVAIFAQFNEDPNAIPTSREGRGRGGWTGGRGGGRGRGRN